MSGNSMSKYIPGYLQQPELVEGRCVGCVFSVDMGQMILRCSHREEGNPIPCRTNNIVYISDTLEGRMQYAAALARVRLGI